MDPHLLSDEDISNCHYLTRTSSFSITPVASVLSIQNLEYGWYQKHSEFSLSMTNKMEERPDIKQFINEQFINWQFRKWKSQ
jgi:hypothetical protein